MIYLFLVLIIFIHTFFPILDESIDRFALSEIKNNFDNKIIGACMMNEQDKEKLRNKLKYEYEEGREYTKNFLIIIKIKCINMHILLYLLLE